MPVFPQALKRRYQLRVNKYQREQLEENSHAFIYQMLKLQECHCENISACWKAYLRSLQAIQLVMCFK